jgi:hypothetical protein
MASAAPRARSLPKVSQHEGFLRHRRFFWLKLAGVLCMLAWLGYALIPVADGPYGGTWFGYVLGSAGAGLIVWLTLLGVRKRAITRGVWSLKGWVSAHVWLGLSLLVIATLHTGMRLGWNLATLAWALMLVVIGTGIYGVIAYATLPAAFSRGSDRQTRAEMIDGLRAIDRQLLEAAQPLDAGAAQAVRAAMDQDAFAAGLWRRLAGHDPGCATLAAITLLREARGADAATARVIGLLAKRRAVLDRVRQAMRQRALLEVWLRVHVPVTLALLAALLAHVLSVFYYW